MAKVNKYYLFIILFCVTVYSFGQNPSFPKYNTAVGISYNFNRLAKFPATSSAHLEDAKNGSGIGLFISIDLEFLKEVFAVEIGLEAMKLNLSYNDRIFSFVTFIMSKETYKHSINYIEYYIPLSLRYNIHKSKDMTVFLKTGIAYRNVPKAFASVVSLDGQTRFESEAQFHLSGHNKFGIDALRFGLGTEYIFESLSDSKIRFEINIKSLFSALYSYSGLRKNDEVMVDKSMKNKAVLSLALGYVF